MNLYDFLLGAESGGGMGCWGMESQIGVEMFILFFRLQVARVLVRQYYMPAVEH